MVRLLPPAISNMNEQTVNALERVDNPILVILLVVLITSNAVVFNMYRIAVRDLMSLAVETVGTLKDLNTRLAEIAGYKIDNHEGN